MLVRIRGSERNYAWGSTTTIPQLIGREPGTEPVAELWFGAHPAAPSTLPDRAGVNLREYLLTEFETALGRHALARFGQHLPYLLKLIAPARPLSLQVHPNLAQAQAGFTAEESDGLPRDGATRLYPDPNHKPELLYAITEFRALCGFRTPRRALELVSGLDAPLARKLAGILATDPTAVGVRTAVTELLTPGAVPAAETRAVVRACAERRGARGASVRIDAIVAELGATHPGDPGAVAALLLNPVTLAPGEALFIPAGTLHAYLQGLGVELMANSDNVLRAGLTRKHIDPEAVLSTIDYVTAPPVRIAPEITGPTRTFYAPVEDFEMSITTLGSNGAVEMPGRGPRIVLSISGQAQVCTTDAGPVQLGPGEAVFVPATAGHVIADGDAHLVQAAVP
ncbi:mannose-6-phosphate isomerase, class I [Pseudactinotalea sp. Z1748]|uniref:mannose-6-phosphate isomerase, class I n=1 Tax=Pseudactinotalea sp. Z1748 TaxID=3413027 RepID=UPI003C79DBF8